jgi:hypothetical protein
MARELKIPLSRQPSNKEHMEVDITHANLLFEAAERHVTDRAAYGLAIGGAEKGLSIYKNWLGLLAVEMERMK